MEAILDFWDAPPKPPQGEFQANWDIRSIGWLDYMLATTKHETASTLQPIDEYGDAAYFTQMYENRSDVNNTAPGDVEPVFTGGDLCSSQAGRTTPP